MTPPQTLSGRIAIVTGGASGIGEAICRLFAKHGATVFIADVATERGEALARAVEGSVFLGVDVTDERQMAAMVDHAIAAHGRLDCMINNAGSVGAMGSIAETSSDHWRRTMAMLLDGVFYGVKHAARVMRPRRSGVILSTASIASFTAGVMPHAYTTAKHALVGLTKSAASELAPHGIRVNAVAPGTVATPLVAAARGGEDKARQAATEASRLRQPILSEDVAEMFLFLASDAAAHVTAQIISVDGGAGAISPNDAEGPPFHRTPARMFGEP